MNDWIRTGLLAATLALACGASPAQTPAAGTDTTGPAAQAAPMPMPLPPLPAPVAATPAPLQNGPPPGFAAPPEPGPGEDSATRARTQPGNNAPFWRGVRESGDRQGVTNLPGAETGVLVQSFVQYPGSRFTTAGEAWREVRNRWLIPYGGSLLLIVAVAIGLFYWRQGPIGGHESRTGRTIERFTPFERAAHWLNAIAFVTLAVSGIVIAFGKYFLLPVLGATLFGWLAYALKNIHNFVGPLFAVSLVVVFVTFLRDNFPQRGDWTWLRKGGGMLSGEEVPSHRFNAGEKLVFWGGVFALGILVVASGLVLDLLIPGLGDTRGEMQVAHMVHGAATVAMMAMFMGHIYIGTIGMKGSYGAMRNGHVDEGWAKAHHEWWYDDVKAGRIPARRSQPRRPADPDHPPLVPAAPRS